MVPNIYQCYELKAIGNHVAVGVAFTTRMARVLFEMLVSSVNRKPFARKMRTRWSQCWLLKQSDLVNF